jgi:pyrimidine deaminase RibD-like protein
MIIPLVAAALFCPTPTVINRTNTFNEQDQQTLVYISKEGCAKQDSNQPCLKIFTKVEDGVYSVLCGPMERRK